MCPNILIWLLLIITGVFAHLMSVWLSCPDVGAIHCRPCLTVLTVVTGLYMFLITLIFYVRFIRTPGGCTPCCIPPSCYIHKKDFVTFPRTSLAIDVLQVVYVHPSHSDGFSGFCYMAKGQHSGKLFSPCEPPPGVLHTQNSIWMYCFPCENFQCNQNVHTNTTKTSAKLAYDNYMADSHYWDTYGCPYEVHINNVIDELSSIQDQLTESVIDDHKCCQSNIRSESILDHTNLLHDNQRPIYQNNIPLSLEAHFDQHASRDGICRDVCIPDKVTGFLNHQPAKFSFIGSDRAPFTVDTIQKCLDIGDTIRQTGVPNYAQARITLQSGLNLDKWEQILFEYPDQMLLQYLKFGFSLSLTFPDQLDNTQVKNHYSATQYPVAIQEYLYKETQLGAMLGPTPFVNSKYFHCSPLLTRPKDIHKS